MMRRSGSALEISGDQLPRFFPSANQYGFLIPRAGKGVRTTFSHPRQRSCKVFVNVVGGLSTRDPGLDLAIAASVLSAQRGDAVPHDVVAIGEVGLRGEVRSVPRMLARSRCVALAAVDQAVHCIHRVRSDMPSPTTSSLVALERELVPMRWIIHIPSSLTQVFDSDIWPRH